MENNNTNAEKDEESFKQVIQILENTLTQSQHSGAAIR